MAKMKYYNGSTWITLDAQNGDTVDGLHFRINLGKLEYSSNGTTWVSAGTDTSDATALANHLLSGKTAYVNGSKITGTIPSKSAATITPGTTNQVIGSGQYLSGNQTILGDSQLTASNIKNGKTIFNVAGSIIPITVNASTNYVAINYSTFYISWPNTYNIRHGYTIPVDGSARMSVDLYGDNGSVSVQFLLNGVSFATRKTSIIGNWTTFTIDKPISSGDELQIILSTTSSSVTGQARNFKIGYSAATPPNPVGVSY